MIDAPALPVLVFDGDCAFCTSTAMWVKRRIRPGHVEPWQSLDLAALGLTTQQCTTALQWVDAHGKVHSAERAVAQMLRDRGGIWSFPGRLIAAPGVVHLAGVIYRWVARHRHRLPGGTPACRL